MMTAEYAEMTNISTMNYSNANYAYTYATETADNGAGDERMRT